MPLPLPAVGETVEILIETVAPNGKGKGSAVRPRYDQIAFFVEATAPGDRVRAVVIQARKRYVEADLTELLAAGPARVLPPCPHYAECGGCQLMHLDYPAQLAAKQEILRYILRRRGLPHEKLAPPEASPLECRYRMRSVLTLGADGSFGMQRRRSNAVVPLRSCHLMRQPLEEKLFAAAAAYRQAMPLHVGSTYPLKIKGVLDPATGRLFLHPFYDPLEINSPRDWFEWQGDRFAVAANAVCRWRVGGEERLFAPDCFTQVNPEVNEKLIAFALGELAPGKNDRVLELYAGIGNFTVPLARAAGEVTAVEWPRGAEFGRRNIEAAGASNAQFIAGEVIATLRQLVVQRRKYELVLLDPPRDGIGEEGVRLLGTLRPARIAYVSCEPLTLVADLEALAKFGYALRIVRAFDMFPQTFHLETCAILER
ncbi:MAG: class I SAM-dependent RNA methyltransferase [Myxococcales bacterium]|nr:class I SAM-dependent RNA methyltransferase [Myxococcales bacterium]